MRSILLLLCGLLFSALCFAQGSVHGTVKDSTGKAVPFATVTLKNRVSSAIVAYSTTTSDGTYNLPVPSGASPDSLLVEVRSIAYKIQAKAATLAKPVDFVLQASVNQLQAVVIKSNRPVLKINGDTTSYKVSDFSSPQDRVIGDVIKKLPGITVSGDGTILYNNKPISNLYINGDNLLDDKYNIATNTIPNGAVNKVQVIQNDQPIKMLQNKVMSDDVALNLDIKKDARLHLLGQESIGAGLPGNYDVNLNAMMFKDKYKAVNYLQGNNTGDDVQQNLVSHNFSDYQQRIDNAIPPAMLSLGTVNDPNLERNRYLFDQSGIINLNNLVNLKKSVQFKANFYYLHDTQKQDYSQQTTVYLPGDTVHYSEMQHNKFRPDILHGQLTMKVNQDKYYLNNALLVDYAHQNSYSMLNTNGTPLNQVLHDNPLNFSNEFSLLRTSKSNNIIETYSYISHSSEPENRAITPGYNAAVFNGGTAYNQLLQNANIPAWYTNNYLSYKIPGNFVTQSIKAGFSLQSQTLNSALTAVQANNATNLVSDSAVNHLNWNRKKIYGELAWDLPGDIFKANLTLPFSYQQIGYSDSLYHLDKSLSKLYFSPQFRMKYQVSTENFFTLQYNYRNQIGSIEDVYNGYILKDYRTLYANNADLTELKNQLVGIGFNYRKALTLFFFSVNALYNHVDANNIASSVITSNLQQRIVLPFQNSTNSWTLSSTVSKYSFVLHTTFGAGVQWQSASSNQVQNNTLLPFKTKSTTLNFSAETKVSEKINFSYKATASETGSHSVNDASAFNIKQLLQQVEFNYDPSDDLLFKLSGEHYFTRQQGNADLKYFFADASARYRIKKWKTDLELSAVNFLNVKTYNALYLSANTLTASSYTLPGRIVLLKMMFNL
ncbi:carboxypeptidase regulatory-like domain-containing protein [Mucilaginibacter ginsenosidivorans]|nr:carboxypeptidase regulatory-like domain-containing protein [Mucilaginibacter ginsenosidivorans]